MITPMDHISLLLRSSSMTEEEFFARQIALWKSSPERLLQITGSEYYKGKHAILKRCRQAIGKSGKLENVENLPNNRIVDNQYALMVDQKKGYLLSKPFTIDSKNKFYAEALQAVFDHKFRRKLFYAYEDALNHGIAWLFPYYDGAGAMRFRRFSGYEILPFWADDEHERLDCAVRLREVESWEGSTRSIVQKVELFKPDGIHYYQLDGDVLVPDPDAAEPLKPYITVKRKKKGGAEEETGFNWERIPLVAIRYNKEELPLISRAKSLQDALNLMLSDFENTMQEDAGSKIIKLRGYGSENLGEFRYNLATFRAVKITPSPGPGNDADVDTLDVDVPVESFETIIDRFKKAIIENARGFDAKELRAGANPNQMNIQSMYSDIDLDADNTEVELDAALEELLWFVNQYLAQSGKGTFDAAEVEIIFNRDMLISESEVIENCRKSEGIISRETSVKQHPWVKDATAEMERMQKEREADIDAFGAGSGGAHNHNAAAAQPLTGKETTE